MSAEPLSAFAPAEQLVLELGRALHRYGAPAHRLEMVMTHLAEQLGIEAQFFVVPTAIFASFGPIGRQRIGLLRSGPGEIRLGKLAQLDELVKEVLNGDIESHKLLSKLAEIEGQADPWPTWVVLPCYGMASLAGVHFFDGGWTELFAAGGIGAGLGLLSFVLGRGPGRHLFVPVAGGIAAVTAQILQQWMGLYRADVVIAAGLVVLLPGLTLTTALTELSTRNLVSGTTRLVVAGLILFELAFGLAFGHRIGDLFVPLSDGLPVLYVLPSWTEPLSVVLASIAFTGIFQARLRDGWAIGLACFVAFYGAKASGLIFDTFLGAWISALTLTLSCNAYAKFFDRPAMVPLVPGILLLVPGSIGLQSMTWMLSDAPVLAVESALRMTLTGIALTVGVATANVVLSPRRVM